MCKETVLYLRQQILHNILEQIWQVSKSSDQRLLMFSQVKCWFGVYLDHKFTCSGIVPVRSLETKNDPREHTYRRFLSKATVKCMTVILWGPERQDWDIHRKWWRGGWKLCCGAVWGWRRCMSSFPEKSDGPRPGRVWGGCQGGPETLTTT